MKIVHWHISRSNGLFRSLSRPAPPYSPYIPLPQATSALDAESEYLVQAAIERNLHGRTVLIVAHRLSTIERADRILVVQRGAILEQGSHEELLARPHGLYARLVRRQMRRVQGERSGRAQRDGGANGGGGTGMDGDFDDPELLSELERTSTQGDTSDTQSIHIGDTLDRQSLHIGDTTDRQSLLQGDTTDTLSLHKGDMSDPQSSHRGPMEASADAESKEPAACELAEPAALVCRASKEGSSRVVSVATSTTHLSREFNSHAYERSVPIPIRCTARLPHTQCSCCGTRRNRRPATLHPPGARVALEARGCPRCALLVDHMTAFSV